MCPILDKKLGKGVKIVNFAEKKINCGTAPKISEGREAPPPKPCGRSLQEGEIILRISFQGDVAHNGAGGIAGQFSRPTARWHRKGSDDGDGAEEETKESCRSGADAKKDSGGIQAQPRAFEGSSGPEC